MHNENQYKLWLESMKKRKWFCPSCSEKTDIFEQIGENYYYRQCGKCGWNYYDKLRLRGD